MAPRPRVVVKIKCVVTTDRNSPCERPAQSLVRSDHHRSDGCYSSWGFCSVGSAPAGRLAGFMPLQSALPGAEVGDLPIGCVCTQQWPPPCALIYGTCLACKTLEFVSSVSTFNSVKASRVKLARTVSPSVAFMEHLLCTSTVFTDDWFVIMPQGAHLICSPAPCRRPGWYCSAWCFL